MDHDLRRHYGPTVAALIVAVFISACATAPVTPLRQHPDFPSAQRKVESVAILPPRVKYTRVVFTGDNERVPERERSLASSLSYDLEQALQARQYTVRKLDDEADATNQELQFDLAQLDAAFDQAVIELYERPSKPEEAKQYRVNVGAIAGKLAERLNADALLIARYAGFQKSGGQKTKDAISGVLLGALTGVVTVQASEGSVLEVALIDGTTGDVLWANRAQGAVFPGGAARTRGSVGPAASVRTALSVLPSREASSTHAKDISPAPAVEAKDATLVTPVSGVTK